MEIAVIKTGGKQYCVHKGTHLRIEKIAGKVGDAAKFSDVLLIADVKTGKTTIGSPKISGAVVGAKIELQEKAKKISVIKFKNKIRYRRNRGHRQPFTQIEVTSITHK